MLDLLKHVSMKKTGFSYTVLAFSAVFLTFSGFLGNALYVTFKQQAVPVFLSIILRLTGMLLGAIFFHILLNKFKTKAENATIEPPADKKKKSSLPASLLNFFFGLVLILSIKHLFPILYHPEVSAAFFAAGVLSLLISLLFVIFLTASWMIVENNSGIKDWFKSLTGAVKLGFGKFSYFAFSFMAVIVSLAVGILLYELSWSFLKSTSLSPLLSFFYVGSLVSCYAGFVLIILLKAIISVFIASAAEPSPKNPLPGYILLVAIILSTISSACLAASE